jgi:hypothetical protein
MIDQHLADLLTLLNDGAIICGVEAEDDHMSTLLVKSNECTLRFLVKGDAPLLCALRPIHTAFGAWVVLPLDSPVDSYAAYPSRLVRVLDSSTIFVGVIERIIDLRKMNDWALAAFVASAQREESSQLRYPTAQAQRAWTNCGHEVYFDD